MNKLITLSLLAILFAACHKNAPKADAYGNFEADEWLVYPEVQGKLIRFDADEGDRLRAGQVIGRVDTSAMALQRDQLKASIAAIYAKKQTAGPDIALLQKRIDVLLFEKQRVSRLLADSVATQKQLDDINNRLAVLQQQIQTAKQKVEIANRGIFAQVNPLRKQIAIINDRIRRARITAPADGVVTQSFVNGGEVVTPLIPLLKLARMDTLYLRAYFSGDAYAALKLNQPVRVRVDPGRDLDGRVVWIAQEAEFTPKIVQTKEERTHLVYAAKIAVPNDGSIKIGMPGEVWMNIEQKDDTK